MARNQADTAKHLIRILQQGGVAADSIANMLVKGNNAAADALLAAVRGGATQSEAIALVRTSMGQLSRDTYQQLTEHGLRSGTYQANSSKAYLELLSTADIKGFKVTKNFVQEVFKVPFPNNGPSINDLFTGQMSSMSRNLVNVTRDAYLNGSTVRQISGIIRSTVGGEGGEIMDATIRRKADALARTSISKVANATREATFMKNNDIVHRVLFVATLDHRTSGICIANDGLWWYLGDPSLQRPPLHVNCRSTLAPMLRGENLNSVKKQLGRQEVVPKSAKQLKDKGLKTRGGKVRKPSSTNRSPLKSNTIEYKSYGDWFKNQDPAYQKSILGPKAFNAYKKTGNLNQALGHANVSQSTWKPGKGRSIKGGGGGSAPPVVPKGIPPVAKKAVTPPTKPSVPKVPKVPTVPKKLPTGPTYKALTSAERRIASTELPDVDVDFAPVQRNHAEKIARGVGAGMTEAEATTLTSYTRGMYQELNMVLRGNDAVDLEKYHLVQRKLINNGLSKLPAFKGDVYRYTWVDGPAADVRAMYKVGAKIKEAGFLSTSASKSAFPAGSGGTGSHVSFTIRNTRTGRDIKSFSVHGAEKEVLFGTDSKFVVKGVVEGKNNTFEIILEEAG